MAVMIKKPGETATVPAGKVAVICTVDIMKLGDVPVDEKSQISLQLAAAQLSLAMQAQLRTDAQIDSDAAAVKAARPSGGL